MNTTEVEIKMSNKINEVETIDPNNMFTLEEQIRISNIINQSETTGYVYIEPNPGETFREYISDLNDFLDMLSYSGNLANYSLDEYFHGTYKRDIIQDVLNKAPDDLKSKLLAFIKSWDEIFKQLTFETDDKIPSKPGMQWYEKRLPKNMSPEVLKFYNYYHPENKKS